jgi:F-type H+-transporting ATPase subunit epsilon
MAPQFHFELVSPEKLVLSKEAVMVTVPGSEGDYGVLAGHSPLITTVRPGVIEVFEKNESTVSERIFIAGGFAEVTNERCTVLAEEATPVANLDRVALEQQAKDLAEDVGLAKTEHERTAAETHLALVNAKLRAISQ